MVGEWKGNPQNLAACPKAATITLSPQVCVEPWQIVPNYPVPDLSSLSPGPAAAAAYGACPAVSPYVCDKPGAPGAACVYEMGTGMLLYHNIAPCSQVGCSRGCAADAVTQRAGFTDNKDVTSGHQSSISEPWENLQRVPNESEVMRCRPKKIPLSELGLSSNPAPYPSLLDTPTPRAPGTQVGSFPPPSSGSFPLTLVSAP